MRRDAGLQTDITAIEWDTVHAELAALRERNTELLAAASTARLDALDLSAQLAEVQRRLRSSAPDLQAMTAERDSLHAQLDAARRENVTKPVSPDGSAVAALREQLAAAERDLAIARAAVRASAGADAALAVARADALAASERARELQRLVESLERQATESAERCAAAEARAADAAAHKHAASAMDNEDTRALRRKLSEADRQLEEQACILFLFLFVCVSYSWTDTSTVQSSLCDSLVQKLRDAEDSRRMADHSASQLRGELARLRARESSVQVRGHQSPRSFLLGLTSFAVGVPNRETHQTGPAVDSATGCHPDSGPRCIVPSPVATPAAPHRSGQTPG
jgi:hypothetical protein